MASTGVYCCVNTRCKKQFTARTADRARGWALFCSKSCKAVKQEKDTGQYANLIHGGSRKAVNRTSNDLLHQLERKQRSMTLSMTKDDDGEMDDAIIHCMTGNYYEDDY